MTNGRIRPGTRQRLAAQVSLISHLVQRLPHSSCHRTAALPGCPLRQAARSARPPPEGAKCRMLCEAPFTQRSTFRRPWFSFAAPSRPTYRRPSLITSIIQIETPAARCKLSGVNIYVLLKRIILVPQRWDFIHKPSLICKQGHFHGFSFTTAMAAPPLLHCYGDCLWF